MNGNGVSSIRTSARFVLRFFVCCCRANTRISILWDSALKWSTRNQHGNVHSFSNKFDVGIIVKWIPSVLTIQLIRMDFWTHFFPVENELHDFEKCSINPLEWTWSRTFWWTDSFACYKNIYSIPKHRWPWVEHDRRSFVFGFRSTQAALVERMIFELNEHRLTPDQPHCLHIEFYFTHMVYAPSFLLISMLSMEISCTSGIRRILDKYYESTRNL